MKEILFDLQLFNEEKVDSIAGLESLLGGNTSEPEEEADEEPKEEENEETPDEPDNSGGDPNLEPPKDDEAEPEKDEGGEQAKLPEDDGKQKAAFARLRKESTQYKRTIDQIAKALGIEETDEEKKLGALVEKAHETLAKKDNLPVEVYKELTTTKEQLNELQMQNNIRSAQDKLVQVGKTYELNQDELMDFAKKLDQEGVDIINNPQIDLDHQYYRLYRTQIEERRIQRAVEEALKKDKAADSTSTTPSKQSSKKQDQEPKKINSVDALTDFFSTGKK